MTSYTDNTEAIGSEDRASVLAPVHDRLRRLQRLSHRRRIEARTSGGPYADTTRGQGRVLAALKLSSPLPTRDLAYLLDIRQQSLNELLTKLEAQGLIERTPSEGDRRVKVVALTQAGRHAATGSGRSEYLNVLSDDEATTLAALLDKVIASLEEELGLEDDDDVEAWLDEARRRMGEERMAGLRRMRELGFGPDHHHGGPHGGAHGGRGHGHHDHGEQGRGRGRGEGRSQRGERQEQDRGRAGRGGEVRGKGRREGRRG
ncbi:MAG: MarR family transcriptional regulator [Actinomyces urogenitalis]|uniref:MarR family winged helix-turn-helix transcriptional regulator n=1 Tax=Actinomyces urogenitalis TaxID=103621 RepID=UPI00242D12AE|nr:MarR family transcriptional regulator [Actinomyces urogenitalis]MCI7457448.1 MarR family transcriptional regulator [Actinomyces urogenitalis]MDY3677979.1 MarR family transcriptional regulator [Actinomyces urogenitalis]